MKIKGILVTILVLIISFSMISCGGSNSISGYYNGQDYQGDIQRVEVYATVPLGAQYTNYAWLAPVQIIMSIASHWGQFADYISIDVTDANSIQQGYEYPIGYGGIIAKMTILGNPISPTGFVRFTKFSNYYSRQICGEFYFEVPDGYGGYFEGSFCGNVSF